MQTIVIAGGSSGIGREAARQLGAGGHRLILMGRDARSGEEAAAEARAAGGDARFLAVDLSTHAGVRQAAKLLLDEGRPIDALLHTTGVLTMKDMRTADGLHPFFSVNFLSRYHLTQLLRPLLEQAAHPRVIMVTSKLNMKTRINFDIYPRFQPFEFRKVTQQIQIGNMHYASYLSQAAPELQTAIVNAGVVDTGIWRMTSVWMRIMTTLMRPFVFNSLSEAAINPVRLCQTTDWPGNSYWGVVGHPEKHQPIELNADETRRVIAECARLTGV
ncbi:MAG: SDR family NAD(P)-dependent oxidoreductase [Leptospirales bacterium]|nr:SDR family NAD(P)-dependent oxidoreductase [Leptospirales bacterium]